jgi:hypothetical protein
MAVATIKFFKWLGIFICIILVVWVVYDLGVGITQTVKDHTNQIEEALGTKVKASDGLENYFPQMCTKAIKQSTENLDKELLGCFTFSDRRGNNRWLLWVGTPEGDCVGLMLDNSSRKPPVEITCEFANDVYEMLQKLIISGGSPEVYLYQ